MRKWDQQALEQRHTSPGTDDRQLQRYELMGTLAMDAVQTSHSNYRGRVDYSSFNLIPVAVIALNRFCGVLQVFFSFVAYFYKAWMIEPSESSRCLHPSLEDACTDNVPSRSSRNTKRRVTLALLLLISAP
ncbi:hypothetical protein EO087_09560 [Dyella sp. M7H15-1]|uniref:hypothetical protein n=1 Tax=Dyella sp. M7H15-1 TaxID=2501295 RepID=UPI001004DA82|nr:hypothetical protein [Dyella sp. M7H15-1]QAU24204.1 hypothetical protein EO087_09560 [Dyella sp. M7H15-1]